MGGSEGGVRLRLQHTHTNIQTHLTISEGNQDPNVNMIISSYPIRNKNKPFICISAYSLRQTECVVV